jgi:biotin carboxylase
MLLVGAWPELANQLVALPARISLLQSPTAANVREREWTHRYTEVDYSEVAEAIAAAEQIHQHDPIDVVVGLREFSLPALVAIAHKLGVPSVPGPPESLGMDKAVVRELIANGAARAVRHRICSTADEITMFGEEVGFPVIVKPPSGAGSIGVHAVDSALQVTTAWRHTSQSTKTGTVLVEELVQGSEYSVETRSINGRHEVVAVTEKLTTGAPHFVEIGHVIPARISETTAAVIGTEALRAVTAIGHHTGPCHVELILTAQGPAIVEINRRLGGDRIWELAHLATGRNIMLESLHDAVQTEVHVGPAGDRAAAIRFFIATEPATVADKLPRDLAVKVPGFIRAQFSVPGPGAKVCPTVSSLDRLGYVLTTADTADSAASAAEEAHQVIIEQLFTH